jgi:hypothetical protein
MLYNWSQLPPRLSSGQSAGEGFGITAFQAICPFPSRARIDPESLMQSAATDSHVREVPHHQLEADVLLIGRNHIEKLHPVINMIHSGHRVPRDAKHRIALVRAEDGLQIGEGLHTPGVKSLAEFPSITIRPPLLADKILSN